MENTKISKHLKTNFLAAIDTDLYQTSYQKITRFCF